MFPQYVLGPFLILTLLSRPRSAGEILAGLASALLLAGTGFLAGSADLGQGLVLAGAAGSALSFGVLSTTPRWSVLTRGVLAVLVTVFALALWSAFRGIAWAHLEAAFAAALTREWETVRALSADPELQARFREMLVERAPFFARVLPGFLALVGLAGMGLAALWHHRIARHPAGRPPGRFRDLRFNDHLIWGAIFTLALTLAPLPPDGRTLAANLLLFWAGLYAARGLAVLAAVLASAPGLFKLLVVILAVVVGPIALGACLAIGLADTWLDIRRRLVPPAAEGVS